jgi:hypothetical protein
MPDQELKARWVAALREPHRKQAQRSLTVLDIHITVPIEVRQCCLGVLCGIDPHGGYWIGKDEVVEFIFDKGTLLHSPTHMSMPPSVLAETWGLNTNATNEQLGQWAEKYDHFPRGSSRNLMGILAAMNDSGYWSFLQIAYFIEAEL